MLVAIALADEDAQQCCFVWDFHLAPVPFLAVDSVNNRWKTSEDSLFLRLHPILLRDAARRLKRDHTNSPADSCGTKMAEPDRAEAKYYREDYVRRRAQPVAFHAEVQRLQAEGRKGGVAAADAGHESQPPFRANQDAAFGSRVSREETYHETTAHVYEQRAERKSLAETPPDDAGKPVTHHTPERTSAGDEQVIKAIHHRS